MAVAARADLEAVLRAHKLDRTLTTSLAAHHGAVDATVPTGIAELDGRLGGGLPSGQVSELVGPRSSGRTSILLGLLAAATRRGEVAALVDAFDTFDVESAAGAGVDLARLLWIRGRSCSPVPLVYAPTRRAADATLDRALKALMIVLQAGGFSLVALDVGEATAESVRSLPFTTWLRIQRVVEGHSVACVLLSSMPLGRSAGGVTVALRPARRGVAAGSHATWPADAARTMPRRSVGVWSAASGPACLFRGLSVEARIIRARGGEDDVCTFALRANGETNRKQETGDRRQEAPRPSTMLGAP